MSDESEIKVAIGRARTASSELMALTEDPGKARGNVLLELAINDLDIRITAIETVVSAPGRPILDGTANNLANAVANVHRHLEKLQAITKPFKCKEDYDACMADAGDNAAKVLCNLLFVVCLAQGFTTS